MSLMYMNNSSWGFALFAKSKHTTSQFAIFVIALLALVSSLAVHSAA